MSKDTLDRKVRQLANELKKNGWKVQAEIKGHNTPSGIGKNNYIPDIVATKAGATKIVKVDTPDTIDNAQISTFKRQGR